MIVPDAPSLLRIFWYLEKILCICLKKSNVKNVNLVEFPPGIDLPVEQLIRRMPHWSTVIHPFPNGYAVGNNS